MKSSTRPKIKKKAPEPTFEESLTPAARALMRQFPRGHRISLDGEPNPLFVVGWGDTVVIVSRTDPDQNYDLAITQTRQIHISCLGIQTELPPNQFQQMLTQKFPGGRITKGSLER